MGRSRVTLLIAIAPVVLILSWFGSGLAVFATDARDAPLVGVLMFGVGLTVVLSAGAVLGLTLRPLPASWQRPSLVAGVALLATVLVGLACAVAFPAASVALRSGIAAPLFAPIGMGLALAVGAGLLVARRKTGTPDATTSAGRGRLPPKSP